MKNEGIVKKRVGIRPLMFVCALVIPLATGGLSSFLTSDAVTQYAMMEKPALSPPGILFPVVWTVLYLMMGIASYFIFISKADGMTRFNALYTYFGQLAMNFCWSIFFFNLGSYLFSFIWLLTMWVLIILCTLQFYRINRAAGLLMVPYLLWTTFAAYLNLAVYILSIR